MYKSSIKRSEQFRLALIQQPFLGGALPLSGPNTVLLLPDLVHQGPGRLVLGRGEVQRAVGGGQVQLQNLVIILLVMNKDFALTELPGH